MNEEPIDLARIINAMSYNGLLSVARELVDMNKEGERDIKTDHGFASTLADWAEATVAEADSQ